MTTKKRYDIVIIGSGAGGGTVAARLAPLCQQGVKIALLEWGPRYTAADNTRQELAMAAQYLVGGGAVSTQSQDMALSYGRAIGGSTSVYTGVSFKAPAEALDKWQVEGISAGELEPRYQRYLAENNVHLIDQAKINQNNRLFAEAGDKLGIEIKRFPVNTRGCQGLATCNLGCAAGAKQGTAQVQIPAAERKGVDVVHLARVDRITDGSVALSVLDAQGGQQPSPWAAGEYLIDCDQIILCAGSVHSVSLLWSSFGARRWPALGRYFCAHPAVICAAKHDHDLDSMSGFPKTYYCDQFADKDRYLLETCMYYPFILAKSLCGFGQQVDDFIQDFGHLQMILLLILDEALPDNRIRLGKSGEIKIDYHIDDKIISSFVAGQKTAARMFLAAGARSIHVPGMDRFQIGPDQLENIDLHIQARYFKLGKTPIASAHLMGGCRMGVDEQNSVTDSWGKVHGLSKVYVADGSLFPGSPEVNPYLTIMALADRVAEGVSNRVATGLGA